MNSNNPSAPKPNSPSTQNAQNATPNQAPNTQTPRSRPSPQSEILQPMNAQPVNPRPMMPRPQRPVEVEESSSPWKKIGLGSIIGIVIVKLIFSSAGKVSHEEAERSKLEPWTQEFKNSFSESCNTEAIKSLKAQPSFQSAPPARVEKIAASYCDCMREKVEAAHIVKTKLDASVGSVNAIKAEMEKAMMDYMNSDDGKAALNACVNQAIAQ